MTGYDYGNARLRARSGALLRAEQYAALLGCDGPGMLARLAATSYRPQAEAARGGPDGRLEPFYRLARDHLIAALTDISGFYCDRAKDVVTALLGRFDVHNVLTLLRQHHHGTAPGTAAAPLVPVGRLDAETALEAAGQPDLPAAARLLAARGLPDPGSAEVLLTAQRRYEIDADLACIEQAVAVCARAHQMKVLTAAGPAADPAADALRRETDDLNLLLALRLRESANGRARGSAADAIAQAYLPGGTVPPQRLAAIGQAPARADVLAAAAPVRGAWRGPLAAWAERSDLATLHADLDTERLRTEFRLLRRADPVGAATILHYVLAHETQARNLRLLAHAAVGAVSQATVRWHLVIPK